MEQEQQEQHRIIVYDNKFYYLPLKEMIAITSEMFGVDSICQKLFCDGEHILSMDSNDASKYQLEKKSVMIKRLKLLNNEDEKEEVLGDKGNIVADSRTGARNEDANDIAAPGAVVADDVENMSVVAPGAAPARTALEEALVEDIDSGNSTEKQLLLDQLNEIGILDDIKTDDNNGEREGLGGLHEGALNIARPSNRHDSRQVKKDKCEHRLPQHRSHQSSRRQNPLTPNESNNVNHVQSHISHSYQRLADSNIRNTNNNAGNNNGNNSNNNNGNNIGNNIGNNSGNSIGNSSSTNVNNNSDNKSRENIQTNYQNNMRNNRNNNMYNTSNSNNNNNDDSRYPNNGYFDPSIFDGHIDFGSEYSTGHDSGYNDGYTSGNDWNVSEWDADTWSTNRWNGWNRWNGNGVQLSWNDDNNSNVNSSINTSSHSNSTTSKSVINGVKTRYHDDGKGRIMYKTTKNPYGDFSFDIDSSDLNSVKILIDNNTDAYILSSSDTIFTNGLRKLQDANKDRKRNKYARELYQYVLSRYGKKD